MPILDEAAHISVESVIEPVLGLLRLLWRRYFENGFGGEAPYPHSVLEFQAELKKECPGTPPEWCDAAVSAWVRQPAEQSAKFSFRAVTSALLPQKVCPGDLSYFAMRSIRRRHTIFPSSSTARQFHALAAAASRLIEQSSGGSIAYSPELARAINKVLERAVSGSRLGRAYVEACQALDLMEPGARGTVRVRREAADAGFFLSHLFGMPTSIAGFDDLFGGGGLMLADAMAGDSAQEPASIGGRAVVCIGPFGSGKTLLSLQFAREVARKGGVAWVVALEQTEEECLYALESLGIRTEHPSFSVVRGGLTEAFVALSNPVPTRGALVFLRPTEEKQNYAEFLKAVESRLSWMSNYPLRLLVIDPVNAFQHPRDMRQEMRACTRDILEAAKRARVNIWFTSEQLSKTPSQSRFEENIADTVIHLGWTTTLGQQRRSIEITKSRFQREEAGRHGFTIESSRGIRVYPSSAALAGRSENHNDGAEEILIGPGIKGMERLLGVEHLKAGDIVALGGPGKGKTLLGVQFLLGYPEDEKSGDGSVFISDYTLERIDRFLATMPAARMQRRVDAVERCPAPTGFVDPGQILELIAKTLEHARQRFGRVRRVLVTNLGRWEQEMPFLKADATFGMALAQMLRNSGAASMVVCGDSLVRGVPFLDTMSDQADFLLQFNRRERQGRTTTLITALKTRQMQHAREEFELEVAPDGLEVKPAPLFRQAGSGELKAVPISLFLYAETANHQEHNQRMVEGLRATISPTAEIQTQSRRFDPSLLSISEFSAVDELQVFQIDEFQLPTAKSCSAPSSIMFSFDAKSNAALLEGRLPDLCRMVTLPDAGRLIAVPFYANLSFFALQKAKLDEAWNELGLSAWPDSWEELADICKQWEALHPAHSPEQDVFFASPVYERGVETLNCLFFEILHTMYPAGDAEKDDLSLWFERPEALRAVRCFRTLCRRAHLQTRLLREKKDGANSLGPRALIARHWYNTLNQELSAHPGERLVEVRPLFGDVSTAGEWYLAIPAHSASPEIGLRLIEFLTTSDRETDRVELGVGLPTRTKYYESEHASVSRYFRFSRAEVYRLLRNALRRSDFYRYQRVSRTISSHLEWAMEIAPGPGETEPETEIERMMESLVENLRFVLRSGVTDPVR